MESAGNQGAGNSAAGVPGTQVQENQDSSLRAGRPSAGHSSDSQDTDTTIVATPNEKHAESTNDDYQDHTEVKKKRWVPNYFLFTRYMDREIALLYAAGTTGAILAGLAFPGLDLLYGSFTTSNTAGGSGGLSAQEAAQATQAASTVGLGLLGIGIGELIFTWIFLVCYTRAGEKMGRKIRNAYLESILKQDIAFFDKVGAGEVAGRTTKDISTIQGGVGEKLAFAIWCFTTIVIGIIVGFVEAARMAGVLLSLIPFTLFLYWVTVHYGNKFTEEELEAEGRAGTFLDGMLGSIRIVQAFSASKALSDRYDDYLSDVEKAGVKKAAVRGSELSVLYYCVITSYALAFWWGSQLLNPDGSGIGIGPLTTTFFVFLSGLFSIAGIVPQISVITESSQVQARIFRDIDRIPVIDSSSSAGYTGEFENSVQLKSVTFQYPSRPTLKSLDDVSMNFESNKTTAIVGQSGSGKSTVTSLLMRFYDPAEGTISLGSRNVKDYRVTYLRQNVAMCGQNPTMFNMSIAENIAAGMTGVPHLNDLSDEKKMDHVREAAKAADAHDFIESLPQGFDTVVGANGAFLSGGQRQRVAIARALIRDPKVLILDEATSALDSSSEKRVYKALAERKGQRTVIVIAHRISSIKDSDKIIVMGDGKVIEEGTHDELLKNDSAYKDLVDKTNANNRIPGVDHETTYGEEEYALPSERLRSRPLMLPRRGTYESKTTPAGATHGSYISRTSTRNTNAKSTTNNKSKSQLTQVPSNIDANPSNLISPDKDGGQRQYSGLSVMRRYYSFAKGQWFWILLGVLGSACLGATFPSSGYLVGLTISQLSDIVAGDVNAKSTVHEYAFYFEIIAIIAIFTGFASGFSLSLAGEKMVRKLRNAMSQSLLRQEVGFFDDDENAVGALTSNIGSHPAAVAAASGLVLSQLLISFFNLIGSIALAYAMSWLLAVVCLAPILLFVALAYANVVFLEKYESEGQSAQDESASYASDNIGAIREVQAMTRETVVHDHYADLLHPDHDKSRLKYLYIGSFGFSASQALVFWISGLTFWWGSHLLTTGQIGSTAFYSTFEAVIIASFSTGRASSFIPDISRAFHSMKVISKYLDRVAKHQTIGDENANITSTERPSDGREIVFKEVSLRYPSRPDVRVLENFNLRILEGQKIAFCGHSGGGKTSTLSLLQRYYDPDAGSITFDGQDIRKISLEDHRARMALVSQDAVLYEGTVAWNLALGAVGDKEVTEEDMRKAAKSANILEFIESLPDGFQTQVGMKGGQLSGGQKQRMCIARALIRNPQILLLDEATSALDAAGEKIVQEALDEASKGRTTITIAHRLSTIANADVIYVVDDGKIVEGGTHQELLKKNGKYKELIEAQLA